MESCTKCNYGFTFYDGIKAFFNLEGLWICPECGSIYKPKPNVYRAIYYFLVISASMFVFDTIVFESFIQKLILQMFSTILTFSIFEVFPHPWNKYIKVN